LRGEHSTLYQCRDDTARVALTRTHNTCGIGTREFSPIEHSFKDAACLRRQGIEPDFFLRPKQNANSQAIRLHQAFHEFNLVDAGSEKEVCKFRESLLAQITTSVKIVTARDITCGKVLLICINVARQAARYRPHGSSIKCLQQHRMRHQTSDAAVPVNERMNPHEAMMCCRRTQDRIRLTEAAVNLLEALQKTRDRTGTNGDMRADFDVTPAQAAGDDSYPFLRFGVLHPQQILWQ